MKMKLLELKLFAAVVCSPMLCAVSAVSGTPITPIPSHKIFIPSGFDDNDQASAVLTGYLPNSCYKVDHVAESIDLQEKTIRLTQMARVTAGPCRLMRIPYQSEVNLGVLPAGEYKVSIDEGKTFKVLTINRSSNDGPDDYFYAPVQHVYTERAENGDFYAVLVGHFTNTCMAFEDIKVTQTEDTIQLLPLMGVSSETRCRDQIIPFKQAKKLGRLMPGEYLLHVRSLDGHSQNVVFFANDVGDPYLAIP